MASTLPPATPCNILSSIRQAQKSEAKDPFSFVHRGSVTANLVFYEPPADGSVPFFYVEAPPEGVSQRNFVDTKHSVNLSDIRGRESEFSLDRNAFATIHKVPASAEHEFVDDESIKRNYYPEVEKLLLDSVSGAQRVLLFDHTVRRAGPNNPRTPVFRAHVDQTPASAAARVSRHLPDEADKLLHERFRLINVWRPLNGPVSSFPLGFADSAHVVDEDLVSIEHRYPDRVGATAGVRYNPEQKWYYWSGMENDERLLLECFDSESPRGRVPHSAFVDHRTADDAPQRQSIEVRALVFG